MKEITLDDLDLDLDEAPAPVLHKARWHAIARVLVLQQTECACGKVYLSPVARDLLVRFADSRTMDIQEISDHPSATNQELAVVRRTLICKVNCCQECAK